MRTLGLVPARGGSKGLPGKNARSLLGRPLLAWTADAALEATTLADVVLSTDDDELAALGRSVGLEVPFARPPHLASDTAPMLGVVQHALDALDDAGRHYDAVCLLQPTSPARAPGLVDRCVAVLAAGGHDAVVSTVPVEADHHPDWAWVEDGAGGVVLATGGHEPVARRQDLRPAYRRDGAVYVVRREVVAAGSLYGTSVGFVVTDPTLAVSIDEPDDWPRAEAALRRLGRGGG